MSTSSSSARPLALDLDGTLIDARPRQVGALAALVDADPELEPLDGDRLWELKRGGMTTREALARLGFTPALAASLSERWVETVEDARWLGLDRLIAGVVEALEALTAGGSRPLILTARRHEGRVRDQVSSLGLLRWCAEVRVVPPSSAAEAKAAELAAFDCRALVGDTESDARAARLASVPFAAVTTGQRSAEFLRAQGLSGFDSLAAALHSIDS